MDAMQEKHERALTEAAGEYQRATDAQKDASARLADAMRAAYNDGEQQSAILRASKHVWSREYLRVILGLTKSRKTVDPAAAHFKGQPQNRTPRKADQ